MFVLEGIGFYIGTEDYVKKTPACTYTGGGPRPCPNAPLAKVVGKYTATAFPSVSAAKADLKTKLERRIQV